LGFYGFGSFLTVLTLFAINAKNDENRSKMAKMAILGFWLMGGSWTWTSSKPYLGSWKSAGLGQNRVFGVFSVFNAI
jgi:hypothetical protein